MTQNSASGDVAIVVNGEERHVPAQVSVAGLLDVLGLEPATVVVELNREIVRREDLSDVHLNRGDQVEVVHFVGGG